MSFEKKISWARLKVSSGSAAIRNSESGSGEEETSSRSYVTAESLPKIEDHSAHHNHLPASPGTGIATTSENWNQNRQSGDFPLGAPWGEGAPSGIGKEQSSSLPDSTAPAKSAVESGRDEDCSGFSDVACSDGGGNTVGRGPPRVAVGFLRDWLAVGRCWGPRVLEDLGINSCLEFLDHVVVP